MKEDPLGAPPARPGSVSAQIDEWWKVHSPDYAVLKTPALAFYAVQSRHPFVPATATTEQRQRADEYWRSSATTFVYRSAENFRRAQPKARVVILQDASHHLYDDREDDVVQEMNEFYRSLPGR